jgi:hypothetical protein
MAAFAMSSLMRRRSLLIAATFYLPAASARGQTPQNRERRRELAQRLTGDFNRFARAIPSLSPAEQEYVDREHREAFAASGGKYSLRLLRLMDGREYNIWEAERWVTNTALCLSSIIKATDVKSEVSQWSRLAGNLTDRTDIAAAYNLKTLKVLSASDLPIAEHLAATEGLFIANVMLTGNDIIKTIIIPYLDGTLP